MSEDSQTPHQQKAELELLKLRAETAKLEAERLKLEKENAKLAAETAWWPRFLSRVRPNEWLTPLVALIALSAALWTGLFDAKRERLEVDRIRLEERKEQLLAENAAAVTKLEAVRRKIEPHLQDQETVEALRRLKEKDIEVRFAATRDLEGVKVSIHGVEKELDWGMNFKTLNNPAVTDALSTAVRLRNLVGLRVRQLALTPADLRLASQHHNLEQLVIESAGLTTGSLRDLQPGHQLARLDLSHNKIASLEHLPPAPGLKLLKLMSNPIDGKGLAGLRERTPGLTVLDLRFTPVGDPDLAHLAKLPELTAVDLVGTKVTAEGIQQLAACPKLNSVDVSEEMNTAEAQAALKRKGAKFSLRSGEPVSLVVYRAFRDDW